MKIILFVYGPTSKLWLSKILGLGSPNCINMNKDIHISNPKYAYFKNGIKEFDIVISNDRDKALCSIVFGNPTDEKNTLCYPEITEDSSYSFIWHPIDLIINKYKIEHDLLISPIDGGATCSMDNIPYGYLRKYDEIKKYKL